MVSGYNFGVRFSLKDTVPSEIRCVVKLFLACFCKEILKFDTVHKDSVYFSIHVH